MTVASEIIRLQWAKSDIRQAIIDKWVDVWASLTIDEYAACILDISTWPKTWYIDILVVWWGWNWSAPRWWWGWGWWAWWLIEINWYPISWENCPVTVWGIGQDSCFWFQVAKWWWNWWGCGWRWGDWWSWWWWWAQWWAWWAWISWQWNNWWNYNWNSGWWWWWAWWAWCNATNVNTPWNWWSWKCSCISWSCQWYSAWWWWWWANGSTWWTWWWWDGKPYWTRWCDATSYWSWWWWSVNGTAWCWCQWIVILRYKTDWSCWICGNSLWWCKYTCGQYTIHCFTGTAMTEQFIPVYK